MWVILWITYLPPSLSQACCCDVSCSTVRSLSSTTAANILSGFFRSWDLQDLSGTSESCGIHALISCCLAFVESSLARVNDVTNGIKPAPGTPTPAYISTLSIFLPRWPNQLQHGVGHSVHAWGDSATVPAVLKVRHVPRELGHNCHEGPLSDLNVGRHGEELRNSHAFKLSLRQAIRDQLQKGVCNRGVTGSFRSFVATRADP